MKCRFGCREYGKSLQCPPYAMTPEEFRSLLADYSQAIMVQDMPPGRDFHRWLLELEQEASRAEFHKALAFGVITSYSIHYTKLYESQTQALTGQ